MIKTFSLRVLAFVTGALIGSFILGIFSPAQSAGTINYSLSQQFDSLGRPLSGCKLYFYVAGTTTVQLSYQDVALTIAHPWPLICDSAGRLPQFYLADGTIKIRLTSSTGVNQGYGGAGTIDGITVIGASSGSGSGTVVDPTTLVATGDLKVRYGTGALTGFVRANGRTIGSATSGASERANSDCQTLFEQLWTDDPNLVVSTGRGASANADWVANKTIALPDWRGRALAALDDMGNSAAGRLTATYFGTAATVLGAAGGGESHQLTLGQLPTGITATGTFSLSEANLVQTDNSSTAFSANAGSQVWKAWVSSVSVVNVTPTASGTVTSNNTGANPHRTVQPTMLATVYLKL